MPSLTMAELCDTWRQSQISLARLQAISDVAGQFHLATVRELCLDELERRDPHGFARWLAHDVEPASDPSRYLGR
ncbi:MAG: hypothetical protein ACR2LI_05365 [Propionibacteriaceae bacterium]